MWQNILKARGLIDPKKLKRAMDLDKKPQFAGLGKRIPKEGRYSDDGEYADVTDNRILDVEFEKKAIRVKGDITVDGKTIPFSASVGLPKPLAVMSKLPYNFRRFHVNSMEFRNNMPKEFLSEENDNFQDGIESYIEEELAAYFNLWFRYFEEDVAYDTGYENKDFFRTSQGLKSGREDDYENVRYDRRSKRDSFKDVLRKPDSSNVREFVELIENRLEPKVLPINEKIVRRLVEKGFFEYDESGLERNTFPYTSTEKARDVEVYGVPINLHLDESFVEGDPSITIREKPPSDLQYEASLYAYLNFPVERRNTTSKERQKLIDAHKAFKRLSGKKILDEILRM